MRLPLLLCAIQHSHRHRGGRCSKRLCHSATAPISQSALDVSVARTLTVCTLAQLTPVDMTAYLSSSIEQYIFNSSERAKMSVERCALFKVNLCYLVIGKITHSMFLCLLLQSYLFNCLLFASTKKK